MKPVLVFMFLCFSSLQAEQLIVFCEKTRVNPNQMFITHDALWVEIDGVLIIPGSLQIDGNGYYFTSILYDEKRVPGPWQCKKKGCYTWNEEWRDYCKQCGTPK